MTTIDRPAQTTTEWQLSRDNLNQIDDQLDRDGIYAKGYWETVDGQLTVTGLRIGSSYADRLIAKFGDTVIRRTNGTYAVRTPAEQAAYHQGQLAEQLHQYLDLDADSVYTVPGCICACPPKAATA
ncbi:hypothetical protein [Streptomyces sp. NPDC093589]|uniref:hypothetical protein n=1 Tax=Streptomyces sp. NPDC093589 TaxID=3366043 RepID=UPI00380C2285